MLRDCFGGPKTPRPRQSILLCPLYFAFHDSESLVDIFGVDGFHFRAMNIEIGVINLCIRKRLAKTRFEWSEERLGYAFRAGAKNAQTSVAIMVCKHSEKPVFHALGRW